MRFSGQLAAGKFLVLKYKSIYLHKTEKNESTLWKTEFFHELTRCACLCRFMHAESWFSSIDNVPVVPWGETLH